MRWITVALLFAFAVGPAATAAPVDPCLGLLPLPLQTLLAQRYPDARLPLSSDSDGEDRRMAAARGDACLLVAKADVDGDGRMDTVLLLPLKHADGFRLVVSLDKASGTMAESLSSWPGSVRHSYVDVAGPGTYRDTSADAFMPAPGLAKTITSARSGFWFGDVEAAADVYFLDHGQWAHVHGID